MSDTTHVIDNPTMERYEIRVGADADEPAGFVEYRRTEGGIEFTHTEIDDAYEGRGLGSQLAAAVLDQARAAGWLVTPTCPFIAGYIARHPGYADLVDPAAGHS